jgi:DNA-binding transcriptional LysR family regulator
MERTEIVGRRLRLRDLKLLDAVVQWGSIAKAASQLNLTQPAASKAIAQLERTLGVRLLDRSTYGVEPTLYGRALLKRGVAIFDEVRQGVKEIEFLADPTAGELRIGCGEVFVAGLLPAIIERLRRQYPRIVCHVDQGSTANTPDFRELRERRVDLVIAHISEAFEDDDLSAEVLFRERTFVVAGKRSRWARRRKISLAELVDESWLLVPSNSLSFAMIEEAFAAQGLKMPAPSIVSFSVHLRNSLLPTGRYLAYLPGSFMHFGAMRSSFKALPVDFPVKPRPVAVITLKNRTLNPVVRLFVDCAREVVKPLTEPQP